eukprot:788878-Rhodomonas_salina.3
MMLRISMTASAKLGGSRTSAEEHWGKNSADTNADTGNTFQLPHTGNFSHSHDQVRARQTH